jgi:orotidine-5'-phosphate decarboxylase
LETFKDRVFEVGARYNSRIVLALDLHQPFSEVLHHEFFISIVNLLSSLRGMVAGVKIGWPTILTLGEEALYRLLNEYDWGFFFIADLKLADVGHINRIIVRHMADLGFDGVITHSFIGLSSGLDQAVKEARDRGVGILALVAMSHPGGEEVLNRNFRRLFSLAMDAGVDGLILPATMPSYIKMARDLGFDGVIMSPGVGPQGASPGTAISHGADFEIIGRLIYAHEDPPSVVRELSGVLGW